MHGPTCIAGLQLRKRHNTWHSMPGVLVSKPPSHANGRDRAQPCCCPELPAQRPQLVPIAAPRLTVLMAAPERGPDSRWPVPQLPRLRRRAAGTPPCLIPGRNTSTCWLGTHPASCTHESSRMHESPCCPGVPLGSHTWDQGRIAALGWSAAQQLLVLEDDGQVLQTLNLSQLDT